MGLSTSPSELGVWVRNEIGASRASVCLKRGFGVGWVADRTEGVSSCGAYFSRYDMAVMRSGGWSQVLN